MMIGRGGEGRANFTQSVLENSHVLVSRYVREFVEGKDKALSSHKSNGWHEECSISIKGIRRSARQNLLLLYLPSRSTHATRRGKRREFHKPKSI